MGMPKFLNELAFLAILGAVFGCTPSPTEPPAPNTAAPIRESAMPTAPETAAAALDQFQSQALSSLPKHLNAEVRAFATAAIKDRDHLHARRLTCQACFERLDGTLTQQERQSLILFGAVDDLRGHAGECWEIMSFGTFGQSIEGYLDASTGRLLVLWIVPEG